MKRKIAIALIIVIIISALIPNFIFAAVDLGTLEDVVKDQADHGQESAESLFEESEATVESSNGNKRTEYVEPEKSVGSFIFNTLGVLLMTPAKLVNTMLTMIIGSTQKEVQEGFTDITTYMSNNEFTIEDVVLGKYDLFDINFFRDYNNKNTGTVGTIKNNVVTWYFALRRLALAISLLVLIYIGIRMAISTVASDRAKYKKMLTSWFTSIILLFTMHYIVVILLTVQETILQLLNSSLLSGRGFEEVIIKDAWKSLVEVTGINKIPFLILYYVLVYYQVKFFVMYFKRFLSVGFLTLISPLVTITYSIDKAGDGKAQAYGAWLREMIYNIIIQVVHAVIYIVFIFSAAEIVKRVPMLGIIFLMALSRAEKVVKSTFSLRGEGFGDYKPLERIKGLMRGGR